MNRLGLAIASYNMDNWFSIVPFFIAIVVAMASRQVLPGLALGLLVGSYSVSPGVFDALAKMADYIFTAIEDRENLRIIVFLYVFGGLVGMMQVAGGIRGFAQWVQRYIRTEKKALVLAWATILVTFMDCEFRIMTTGPVMRTVKDKIDVARSKLGYAIDTSTVPVIVLIPVATTYVGYMVSVVGGALDQANIDASAYGVFLSSIPFNFWAWTIVVIGLVAILTRRFIGQGFSENGSEREGDDGENEGHRASIEQELEQVKPKPLNLVFPLLTLLTGTFYLIWRDGQSQGAGNLLEAMQKADATQAMLVALFLTTVLAMLLFLVRREDLTELMFHFIDGGNQLAMAIVLLVLVWAMASLSADLGFSEFISGTLGTLLPRSLVPVIIFLFGSLIAYFIGSSWGTWGILMPLAVSLVVATGASLPLTVGAVFASGSFGDFTSPLGETTVTTAAVFDMAVIDHAKAKLPSSLTAVGIASILFLVFGFIL